MTRIVTTILLLAFWLTPFAQQISVDTLFIQATDRFSNIKNEPLKFPLIKTGNHKIDKAITHDLKNRFTNYEYTDLATDSTLIKWAGEQIVYLNFEVTYIKNGLISFNISAEGCGAHCTGWTDYFTYNYLTAQYITINQIVDTTGSFKKRVVAEKDKQYEQQKKELKELLLNQSTAPEEDTYKWVLEQYESCEKEFTLNSFALYYNHLEIIDRCYLPNAIKSLTPRIALKYKYADIKKHLKIKY